MPEFTVYLSDPEHAVIEQARGLWGVERFVKSAALAVADDLLTRSTEWDRFSAVPNIGRKER